MSQQAIGDRRLPSDRSNHSADVSEDSSLRRGKSVSWDHSDDARPSPQDGHEKARNRLGKSPSSRAKPNGLYERVYMKWNTTVRVQTLIIGLYVMALACAYGHWMFFECLNGRILAWNPMTIADPTTMIPQGYATTVSLLLTIAFKAALIGSVGLCYTQNLWATLRKRTLKIGLIEDLFQVQTNVFHLTSSEVYINAPILAAVALFGWVTPLAMIYPPGALIVELDDLKIDTRQNVSVFHATSYTNLSWASISCIDETDSQTYFSTNLREQQYNLSRLELCHLDTLGILDGVNPEPRYVARSSLMSGEIASLSQPGGPNSSYTMDFWGTILDCETVNRTVETEYPSELLSIQNGSSMILGFAEWSLTADSPTETPFESAGIYYRRSDLNKESHQEIDINDENPAIPLSGITVRLPVIETVCRPKIASYSVTVSSEGSEQRVSTVFAENGSLPIYTESFGSFKGSFEQWVQFSDAVTIYNEFAGGLNKSWNTIQNAESPGRFASNRSTISNSTNGNSLETCILGLEHGSSYVRDEIDIWPLSVFQRRLGMIPFGCVAFDGDMAKDLLVNTTISAMALNKHFGMVSGTEMRTFNVYLFRNKLAFFVPYGLSVGLGLPIIVLGILSFYIHNEGVSAIDGGFLQIFMTTTGRTDLGDMVHKNSGTLGGYENVSNDLKEVEARFGELIKVREGGRIGTTSLDSSEGQANDIEEVQRVLENRGNGAHSNSHNDWEKNQRPLGRAGFGLAHEVRPLRRRNIGS